jgi:alanyl-tRNA synthetase
MESAEIARRWLRFFEDRGHTVVPSASLIADDPNLLLVNAGMVPFKPYFLGEVPPPYPRAASIQKCVRTLDIDEVGRTTRHASFFQMCGNFSFGDYFKEQAIPLAWELLTSSVADGGYGLPADRLWVTVYDDDDEAETIWRESVGVPAERIQRRGMADNFWSMGVPGPCGPCSEIFYDRGPEYGAEGGPVADEDRYIEIWNLVFMQFERGDGGGKKDDYPIVGELPAKNIDTGLGLERLATILQDVDNLYEIDTTRQILDRATELTGKVYGQDEAADVRLRIVADHTRTAALLVGDGVTPGNEGRSYVLRRMMRRVVRNMRLLGAKGPTSVALAEAAIDAMSPQYPELAKDRERIRAVTEAEERAFAQTLDRGTAQLDAAVAALPSSGQRVLAGAQAFALHDTFGFPIDLTLEMAAEHGVEVDEDGFRTLMTQQRDRAKADAKSKKAGHADVSAYRELLDLHGPTDWLAYEGLRTEARVLGLLSDGAAVPALGQGQIGEAILDRTTFYAESGGQHADAGHLVGDGVRVEVLDVQRPVKGLVVHQVRVLDGELRLDSAVQAEVDPDWRRDARQAHSGTHVVHAALREVLGPTALQSGSFNRPGYLRLDFAWQKALSRGERQGLEEVSNRAVRDDLPVTVDYMTLAEAQQRGALALFGENYGEQVRVVEIGGPWSSELCGGTHVASSAQIGPLVVTGESSVGSGVRRVEAVVGLPAFGYLAKERDLVGQLAELLNARPSDVKDRVEALLLRVKDAERELDQLRAAELRASAAKMADAAHVVDGVTVVSFQAPDGLDAGAVRQLVMDARGGIDAQQPAVVVGAGVGDGKVAVVAATNDAGRARGLSANDILRAVLVPLGGRGGGKDDVAQGGGTAVDAVPAGLAAVDDAVRAAVGS